MTAKQSKYADIGEVKLHHVYDGDTIHVTIPSFAPIAGENVGIRVLGIDTPEMHDHDPAIKKLALEAKQLMISTLKGAKKIELKNCSRGKYYRYVAYVYADGINVSMLMLKAGLAKEYWGGTKQSWKADKQVV